jgi:hypothetical protein
MAAANARYYARYAVTCRHSCSCSCCSYSGAYDAGKWQYKAWTLGPPLSDWLATCPPGCQELQMWSQRHAVGSCHTCLRTSASQLGSETTPAPVCWVQVQHPEHTTGDATGQHCSAMQTTLWGWAQLQSIPGMHVVLLQPLSSWTIVHGPTPSHTDAWQGNLRHSLPHTAPSRMLPPPFPLHYTAAAGSPR